MFYAQQVSILPVVIQPKKALTTQDLNNSLSQSIIQSDPNYYINRFAGKTEDWFLSIIKDYTLTPSDKFYKIFGFKITDLQNAVKSTVSGIGSIFDDVGGWFSNLFSSENMNSLSQFLRTLSNQANNSANVLQYSQNQPNAQQLALQQQQLMQYQLNAQGSLSNFLSVYGSYVAIGGVILLILFFKK